MNPDFRDVVIKNASREDEGIYRCAAYNDFGMDITEGISVRMAFVDDPPPGDHFTQFMIFIPERFDLE